MVSFCLLLGIPALFYFAYGSESKKSYTKKKDWKKKAKKA
jgi:hypothetical protein